MKLRLQKFIEKKLLKAQYEYDKSINQWVGWINEMPGVHAQANNIEKVREELTEIIEEWVLLGLRDNQELKGFNLNLILKDKSYV